MSAKPEGRASAVAPERPVVYCVVPAELAEKLHEPLREHFAEQPGVEVIVERRRDERRNGEDRRATAKSERSERTERRKVRAHAGRRVGERRAEALPVLPLPLPRRARRYADQIMFARRLEPAKRDAEDRDTARLIARFQAGDRSAFDTIYKRYFDRVFTYMRVALEDREEAEDATQEVFVKVLASLRRYEERGRPVQAWLFTIVRNVALTQLRRIGRYEPVEPDELERLRHEEEGAEQAEEVPEIINWITDRDLAIFVERLPLVQRQVLVLRYLLDLTSAESGKILNRSPDDVRMIQHRAVNYLRERLAAVRRPSEDASTGRGRARSRSPLRQSLVLRGRRFSLISWK